MFSRILIANRGEIACRIARTARLLGVQTVGVYSDADADALHVQAVDQAIRIGPAPVAESYLNAETIIQAAVDTSAEAIHPGYGFLSENPDFVDAVATAGLTFIGPSADAIRKMGLKDAAKALMQKAGVPVVPGYLGEDQDAARLAQEAETIGYPVLIKAVAGGGGKGMRLVDSPAGFAEALASAKAEARTAFGNDRVLIEKFIANPRHIEVQIFGDGTSAVHLFERDCSLQRRHQKVIEEAPAPGMTAAMRAAMGQAAVRAAEAVGYTGAGTVEFIVDGGRMSPDGFWFMEMNTRLQVEHPVTEAVVGVDLVEWQLRVAAGAALPMSQDQLSITGHALEARLYAEDAGAGFLPATGRIAHLIWPDAARIDTGVAAGAEVSVWYDPMLAKIITHGADRDAARQALARALQQTELAGVVTNLGFLRRLVDLPDFAAGDVETGLIGRHQDALTAVPAPAEAEMQAAAQAAFPPVADDFAGFTLWDPLRQSVLLEQAGAAVPVVLDPGATGPKAIVHGAQVTVLGNWPQVFDIPDPLDRGGAAAAGGRVLAPMPGLVQAVSVAVGDNVSAGDRLVVLEAMKMEHVLRAPRDGVVAAVAATAGAQVAAGLELVTLKEETT